MEFGYCYNYGKKFFSKTGLPLCIFGVNFLTSLVLTLTESRTLAMSCSFLLSLSTSVKQSIVKSYSRPNGRPCNIMNYVSDLNNLKKDNKVSIKTGNIIISPRQLFWIVFRPRFLTIVFKTPIPSKNFPNLWIFPRG